MASGAVKTEAKGRVYGLGCLENRGKRQGLWLRFEPRPKAMTFWPRPNMLRFPNRYRILKTTAAKGPSCTGDHRFKAKFDHHISFYRYVILSFP